MRHIHIVDDNAGERAALRALFSDRSDVIIRCFGSGEAFLGRADELDGGVVLLALHMPEADGMDVLTALGKDGGGHVPLILAERGDVKRAVGAMKAGAADYIEKPAEADRLINAVEQGFARLARQGEAAARTRAARARIGSLSPREGDVLKGLMAGQANKVIASQLALSPRTVEIHRANLLEKLSARSLPEALRVAWTAGLYAD